MLTEAVLRDERLHELALTTVYNLRSRPEVLLLLRDADCREGIEDAAVRLDQTAPAGEAVPRLREVLLHWDGEGCGRG